MGAPPLVVDDLRIGYGPRRIGTSGGAGRGSSASPADGSDVVHGVSFVLERGRTLSLVGQSGSGKSTTAHAVAGLLPHNGQVTGGRVLVQGDDATAWSRRRWRDVRGSTIGFVPQDPLSSLDPLQRVGAQIAQSLRTHHVVPRAETAAAVVRLLERVGIRDAARRARAYPHELSGGQLQRVLIAIAIAAGPSILIADEPTSALDVTIQATILDLLGELQGDLGLSILFITHDLALARDRSDEIAVLDHGRLREIGPAVDVLERPQDPYTIGLLADAPALSPDRYADRARRPIDRGDLVIEARELRKTFGAGRRPGRAGPGAGTAPPALDGVSLSVARGSVHALVGESGSGKTTLARIVAGLEGFDSGAVDVIGRPLAAEPPPVAPDARRLQLVYQNPLAAVDPRWTARQIIEEPLVVHGIGDRAERRAAVARILDEVALPSSVLDRRPREVSGGQRQRIALARALVLAPEVLVLDEPTSALDVSVQAQVVDLLLEVQRVSALSYLFITHDLSLVRQIADDVTVLDAGRVVETGSVRDVFDRPTHERTRALLDAVPGVAAAAV